MSHLGSTISRKKLSRLLKVKSRRRNARSKEMCFENCIVKMNCALELAAVPMRCSVWVPRKVQQHNAPEPAAERLHIVARASEGKRWDVRPGHSQCQQNRASSRTKLRLFNFAAAHARHSLLAAAAACEECAARRRRCGARCYGFALRDDGQQATTRGGAESMRRTERNRTG